MSDNARAIFSIISLNYYTNFMNVPMLFTVERLIFGGDFGLKKGFIVELLSPT